MAPHVCSIVPPYLLRSIAESSENSDACRQIARVSLAKHEAISAKRALRFAALSQPRSLRSHAPAGPPPSIVPEILLRHIAESADVDDETRARAARDADQIQVVTSSYRTALAGEEEGESSEAQQALGAKPKPAGFYRAVHDAKNVEDEEELPGVILRVEGQQPAEDAPVNEAFDNVGKVLDFYLKLFNWKSIDDRNMHVISSVHFGKDYENAFWDPERMQMVFGDGHDFLHNFTSCIDVIGHELTHAVTEHTSPLEYSGQPGALNEHVSDVFGIMVKQMAEDETADKADWLIGEGCLLPGVKGVALRSLKEPGTAYNDPRFGKDPQPADMSGYKRTTQDNGGVHVYSGIPNRAFYLASVAFGGYSWEKAGQIWWKTLNSGRVPARCTFIQFADATTDTAAELYGDDGAKIVRAAWNEVGVVRKH